MNELSIEFCSSITLSIVIIAFTVILFSGCYSRNILQKEVISISPENIDEIPSGTLDRFSDADRWKIQTRVANARTAIDLLNIFSEFQDLQSLQLPTISSFSTELHLAKEQAFRDLIRERVVINDKPIEPGSSPSSDPSEFKRNFEARIQEVIAKHVSDPLKRKNISMHICCHLSRTRAGGDSLFAVQDIFTSPQLVITASPHYTHPPVDLLVTEKGWAIISTTSNFDVYLEQDLADNTDDHPEPLVTISALSEEAIPVSESAQKHGSSNNTNKSSKTNTINNNISTKPPSWFSRTFLFQKITSTYDEQPLPISRKLRLSCSLPANNFTNWDFPREARHKVLEEHKQILIELQSDDDGCLGESCISNHDLISCSNTSTTTTSEINSMSSHVITSNNYYHPNNNFYNHVTKTRKLPRRIDGRARTKRPLPPKQFTSLPPPSMFPPPTPHQAMSNKSEPPLLSDYLLSQKYRDQHMNAQFNYSATNNNINTNNYDNNDKYNNRNISSSLNTNSRFDSTKNVTNSSSINLQYYTGSNNSNSNSKNNINNDNNNNPTHSIKTNGDSNNHYFEKPVTLDNTTVINSNISERCRIRNDSVAQLRELGGAFRKSKSSRENLQLQLQDLSSSGSGNGKIIPTNSNSNSNNSDNEFSGGGRSPALDTSPGIGYFNPFIGNGNSSPIANQQKKKVNNTNSNYYPDDERRWGDSGVSGSGGVALSPSNRNRDTSSNKNDFNTLYYNNQSRSE